MNKFYPISLIISFLLLALSHNAVAQSPTCDGSRYLDDLFIPTAAATVKYGENTTIGGNFRELMVDVYEPESDGAAMRPLIILAFGGSFIGGSRGDMANACRIYAAKGYVAASIDYRLYDGGFFPLPDSADMTEEVLMAVADFKAAIRFFRKDAATTNQFRIDPNNIFIGGFSAGAIAADHAAYVTDINEVPAHIATILNDNGGIEGDTDDPNDSAMGYSSEIQGVANFFGALNQRVFINAGDPPLTSIHGTDDGIVPYSFGYATILTLPIISMEGSASMHVQADNEGIWNHFISVPGGGHGDYMSDPVWADSMYNSTTHMMEGIVCGTLINTEEIIDLSRQIVAFPNPTAGNMSIAFNGLNLTYDVLVVDNAGRTILSLLDHNDDLLELDRANFAPGFYHAQIRFKDEKIAPVVKKLVFTK